MSTMAMFDLVKKMGCKLCFSRTRPSKQGAIWQVKKKKLKPGFKLYAFFVELFSCLFVCF